MVRRRGQPRRSAFFVFFLLVAAALALLWFLGALRGVLVRAEGDPARWTALAYGAGVASATLLLASASLFVAPAATAGAGRVPVRPGDGERVRERRRSRSSSARRWSAALLVLATSIVALPDGRPAALDGPRRLRGRSRCSSSPIFFLPLFVWLAWVLAISIVLIVRTARVTGWRSASTEEERCGTVRLALPAQATDDERGRHRHGTAAASWTATTPTTPGRTTPARPASIPAGRTAAGSTAEAAARTAARPASRDEGART